MLEVLLILVCLAMLIVGSGTDIKWREVPDWVNFAGIAAGLGIRALASAVRLDWQPLLNGLYGFGAMFVFACALFYLGQWGGGDSKMLMAFGALLGLEFSWNSLLLAFLVWTMIVGAFYGMIWSLVLGIQNRKKVLPAWKKLIKTTKHLTIITWIIAGVTVLLAFAVQDVFLSVVILALAIMLPLLLYAGLFTKCIEQCCMIQYVSPDKITEGDWIAKDVVVKGKRITGPKDLGITKKQIAQLKRLKVKKVLVKNGIPFVPALLISFILTLIFGNVLRFLF